MWRPSRPPEGVLRRRTLGTGAAAAAVLLTGVLAPEGPVGALPVTGTPTLELARVVRTSPFSDTRQSVLDSPRAREPVGFTLDDETRAEVDRLFDLLSAHARRGPVPA